MIAMFFRRVQTAASVVLLTLLLGAMLTACGSSANAGGGKGSGGAGAAGPEIDACALVTRAEAEELLGVPVGEPTPKPVHGGVTTCSIMPAKLGDLRQIFIWTNPRQTADAARSVFANTKAGADDVGGVAREQTGIGDAAFWADNQLWVLHGKVVLGLSTDSEAHTLSLVNQVLERLP